MIEILQGDCLEVLKTLPDDSVQMCVTSPPYYGLRDYGTGQWEGGDEMCAHAGGKRLSDKTTIGRSRGKDHRLLPHAPSANILTPYRSVCAKCGATRIDQQIGLESSVDAYVARLVDVFREVRRCLKPDGVIFVNLGDSYAAGAGGRGDIGRVIAGAATRTTNVGAGRVKRDIPSGLKPKDLIGVPWRCAFALQADGWYLRQDLIWHKPNTMPESVKDRCTRSHEYIFLLSKSARYYYDADAVREPHARLWDSSNGGNLKVGGTRKVGEGQEYAHGGGYPLPNPAGRNRRSVWTVSTRGFPGAHFATFPPKLIEPCILAGSRSGDVVLDPFFGSGTTALVARQHGRRCIGIELNADYIQIAQRRLGLAADPLEEEASCQPAVQPGLFEAIPV